MRIHRDNRFSLAAFWSSDCTSTGVHSSRVIITRCPSGLESGATFSASCRHCCSARRTASRNQDRSRRARRNLLRHILAWTIRFL